MTFARRSGHDLVDDHFAGRTTGAAERRFWRHLPSCTSCRGRYRALALVEALEGDGTERARTRIGRGLRQAERARFRPFFLAVGFATAVACCLVILLRPRYREEFRARGGAVALDSSGERSVQAFRVPAGGAPQRLGSLLRQGDGLAFAYVNTGTAPRRFLALFAIDSTSHIYWYWPAWDAPEENPQAIAIVASASPVELAQVIRHEAHPGKVRLVGLFTDRPLRVREIERWAAERNGDLSNPPGDLWTTTIEVTP